MNTTNPHHQHCPIFCNQLVYLGTLDIYLAVGASLHALVTQNVSNNQKTLERFVADYQQFKIQQAYSVMLDSLPIRETVSQIKAICEQNENDMFQLTTHYQQNQPLYQFMHAKMQALQQIIVIATNAMDCVQDLQDEKHRLDKNNQLLKQDLSRMCEINMRLEERIEELILEIGQLRQQLNITLNNFNTFSADRINQNKQFLWAQQNIQPIIYYESPEDPIFPDLTFHESCQQQNSSPLSKNEEVVHLSQQPVKDTMLNADNVNLGESVSYCKLKVKNKLSLLSQESYDNKSVGSGLQDSGRYRFPVKLNEELRNLNLNSFNSIFEIETDEIINETKETDETISVRLQNPRTAQKNQLCTCRLSAIEQSFSQPIEIQNENQKSLQLSESRINLFGAFRQHISKLHNFCYQKIVRGRINPYKPGGRNRR